MTDTLDVEGVKIKVKPVITQKAVAPKAVAPKGPKPKKSSKPKIPKINVEDDRREYNLFYILEYDITLHSDGHFDDVESTLLGHFRKDQKVTITKLGQDQYKIRQYCYKTHFTDETIPQVIAHYKSNVANMIYINIFEVPLDYFFWGK